MIKTENLKIWLDADTLNTPYGDKVTMWQGREGTTISASNTTALRAPSLENLDGVNYVYFDGTQKLNLSTNIFANNLPMTIVALIRPLNNGHIVGLSTSSAPYYPYLKGLALVSNQYGGSARRNGTGVLVQTALGDYFDKNEIVSVRFQNKNSHLKTSQETVSDLTNNLDFYPYSRATIGASDGSAINTYVSPLRGYISEILVFDTYLTDDEVAKVENDIRIRKFMVSRLIVEDKGVNKYYNSVSDTWDVIPDAINTQTIKQYGVTKITSTNTLSREFKVLAWLKQNINGVLGDVSATPHPQLVYPLSDISLVGVENIDDFNLLSTGDARVAISFNKGVTWSAFKNGVWTTVNDAHSGMTNLELNALTPVQIESGRNSSDTIRFSYSLSNNADVDSIQMKVSLQGTEILANTSSFDLSYNEMAGTIIYSIKKSGSYSCTYVDE